MMDTVKKIGKIRLLPLKNAANRNSYVTSWAGSILLNYTKYNIKESDFRVKTATFTSPDYIDLTEGVYAVLISSRYHENFSGLILDVDYDAETKLYSYQCQDWSRTYTEKRDWFNNGTVTLYDMLVSLITRMQINELVKQNAKKKKGDKTKIKHTNYTYNKAEKKHFKKTLSGLRPIGMYNQKLYTGNKYTGNPFKKKLKVIMRDKTFIETIRSLVLSQLGFFDIWFNDKGILQIEPISKKDWEKTGLHLTTPTALKQKYKFSTTNAITTVNVNGTGLKTGTKYDIGKIKGNSNTLNLAAFFGWIGTSIQDPTQKDKNVSNATKTNASSANVNSENPYGTKRKEVWITIDNIFGQSADRKIMNDFAKAVEKAGWKTHVGNVGPSYHYAHAPGYSWSGQVQDAVWFVIYGGACAGTLYEAATANWYRQPLTSRGSRTVVGFIHPPCGDIRKGGKYYSWLPRAHDDNFSPSSFTGIKNPGQFLTDKAIPWMYAKDGTSLAASFLKGGDNPEACNKNWKF